MTKTSTLAQAALAVSEVLISELTKELGDPAIGANQLVILLALRRLGEVHQQDLPELIGVERSAVSRNVAKLGIGEKPGVPGPELLESFEDRANRRLKIVRLTPAGRKLVDAVALRAAAHLP